MTRYETELVVLTSIVENLSERTDVPMVDIVHSLTGVCWNGVVAVEILELMQDESGEYDFINLLKKEK